jgi:parvulin-like peptidyl-prolyl isomerase
MRLVGWVAVARSGTFRALRLASLLAVACSPPAPAPSSMHPLATGDVARVGAVSLPSPLVSEVARTQRVQARAALAALTEDALLAQAAPSLRVSDDPDVRFASATALARRVTLHLADEARAMGSPTDEELGTVEVIHALVPRSGGAASDRARLALATAIRQAVSSSTSADDFERRVGTVPATGVMLRVERVPSFGADGQMSEGGQIDPSFAAAAFGLSSTNRVSPVVETPFGWHVLRLIDRAMPDPHSIEQRRHELAEAVVAMRARRAVDSLRRARRERTDVTVAPEAEALTAAVPVSQL